MDDDSSVEDAEVALRVQGQNVVEDHDLGGAGLGRDDVPEVSGVTILGFETTVSMLKG